MNENARISKTPLDYHTTDQAGNGPRRYRPLAQNIYGDHFLGIMKLDDP